MAVNGADFVDTVGAAAEKFEQHCNALFVGALQRACVVVACVCECVSVVRVSVWRQGSVDGKEGFTVGCGIEV